METEGDTRFRFPDVRLQILDAEQKIVLGCGRNLSLYGIHEGKRQPTPCWSGLNDFPADESDGINFCTSKTIDFNRLTSEFVTGGDAKDVCFWNYAKSTKPEKRFVLRKKLCAALLVPNSSGNGLTDFIVVDKFGDVYILTRSELERLNSMSSKLDDSAEKESDNPAEEISSPECEPQRTEGAVSDAELNKILSTSPLVSCMATATRVLRVQGDKRANSSTDFYEGGSVKWICLADRDEKIRVCNFPNIYNIEWILTGHTQFIADMGHTSLGEGETKKDLLVSVSADRLVGVWDLSAGSMACSWESPHGHLPCQVQMLQPDTESASFLVSFVNSASVYKFEVRLNGGILSLGIGSHFVLPRMPSAVLWDYKNNVCWWADYSGVVSEVGENLLVNLSEEIVPADRCSDVEAREQVSIPTVFHWKHICDLDPEERRERRLRHSKQIPKRKVKKQNPE